MTNNNFVNIRLSEFLWLDFVFLRCTKEVIEECAAFPYGDHDDLVDSTTQALMRFRQGGLIGHPEDYAEGQTVKRKREYY